MSVYLRREVYTKESSLIRDQLIRSVLRVFLHWKNENIWILSTDLCGLRVVFAKGYEQSQFPFRDSEGKEKQASEREIDCGSTGALAFKDVGDFRPRSLVYFFKGIPELANRI